MISALCKSNLENVLCLEGSLIVFYAICSSFLYRMKYVKPKYVCFVAKNTPRTVTSSIDAAPLSVRAPSHAQSVRTTGGEPIVSEPQFIPGLSEFADLPPPSYPPQQKFQQTYNISQKRELGIQTGILESRVL